MGTPAFAVPALAAIAASGHRVVAVYTRAPKPGGRRGLELMPSPVHTAALRSGLEVVIPQTLRSADAIATLQSFTPEVVVVAAYGLILPKAVLDVPSKGCLNLHASLLPRWRGAAPVQRAIMAGDTETGIMVMRMEEGLDEGPVAFTGRVAIGPDANAGEITQKLAHAGADLILRALAALEQGELVFTPQAAAEVSYARKISKEEARIDWRQRAKNVHNLVRALAPLPGAYFEAELGKELERVKVLRTELTDGEGTAGLVLDDHLNIACGEGSVRLLEVQRPGKRPMRARDFLRGVRIGKGTPLALANNAAL